MLFTSYTLLYHQPSLCWCYMQPLYKQFFKIEVFGLGFVTSVVSIWLFTMADQLLRPLPYAVADASGSADCGRLQGTRRATKQQSPLVVTCAAMLFVISPHITKSNTLSDPCLCCFAVVCHHDRWAAWWTLQMGCCIPHCAHCAGHSLVQQCKVVQS